MPAATSTPYGQIPCYQHSNTNLTNVCNVRSPTHRPYGLRSDELHKYQLHEYSSTIYSDCQTLILTMLILACKKMEHLIIYK